MLYRQISRRMVRIGVLMASLYRAFKNLSNARKLATKREKAKNITEHQLQVHSPNQRKHVEIDYNPQVVS